ILTLFEQMNLPEDIIQSYFSNSVLQKLIVHQQSKEWDFHINIDKPLPFKVYQSFVTQLNQSFQHIASTQLTLHTNEMLSIPEEEFEQYWQLYTKEIPSLMPNLANLVLKQPLHLENQTMIIYGRNEIEVSSLRKRL